MQSQIAMACAGNLDTYWPNYASLAANFHKEQGAGLQNPPSWRALLPPPPATPPSDIVDTGRRLAATMYGSDVAKGSKWAEESNAEAMAAEHNPPEADVFVFSPDKHAIEDRWVFYYKYAAQSLWNCPSAQQQIPEARIDIGKHMTL